MRYLHAKRLHNGDEVICKTTGESVKVLSIEDWDTASDPKPCPPPTVRIEGVGVKSGHKWWSHTEVR